MRNLSKIGLAVVLAGTVAAVGLAPARAPSGAAEPAAAGAKKLPRLLDLGSKACIPCKKMAPILDAMKRDYAGRFKVEFVDVWLRENVEVAKRHRIRVIPTQIFFSPDGKELWRHEGFMSKEDILAKWKALGHDFGDGQPTKVERWAPAKADPRGKDAVCHLCDGDVGSSAVVVKTDKGAVRLCGAHCYFVLYSALTKDTAGLEKKAFVSDSAGGKLIPAASAAYLRGVGADGRPTVKAFADGDAALAERRASGGNVMPYATLKRKELSHRCGFCDRAVYPEDASRVKAGGVYTWGCCPHCALGVAARTGKDIEVHQPDALTGEMIVVKTLNGSVVSLQPKTAVAWFGMRKRPDGTWGSAGCFHQANFASVANLKQWLSRRPLETGKLITIQEALAAKMKLTPGQISKACKIGECAPK